MRSKMRSEWREGCMIKKICKSSSKWSPFQSNKRTNNMMAQKWLLKNCSRLTKKWRVDVKKLWQKVQIMIFVPLHYMKDWKNWKLKKNYLVGYFCPKGSFNFESFFITHFDNLFQNIKKNWILTPILRSILAFAQK